MFYEKRRWLSVFIVICALVVQGCDQAHLLHLARRVFNIEKESPSDDKRSFKVVGVKDGDTVVLLMDSTEQVVRLAHIDCPERRQPFGTKAKQFVSDACFGQYVTLQIDERNKYDRNKRLIAEIILSDGTSLNKSLVHNGLAWHFVRYSDDSDYAVLEQEARANNLGIWSEADPIPPWEWRKKPKRK